MRIEDCSACSLHETRTNIVNGYGNKNSNFMFVGEAPGRDEDLKGLPFVGASGTLIDTALERIGICRDDIYISNIVKCRPPKNRDPKDIEIETCLPYIMYEIMLIKPKIICLLGRIASKVFIPKLKAITKEEGSVHTVLGDVKVIPICHPSYYLRNYAPKERFFSAIEKAYKLSLA